MPSPAELVAALSRAYALTDVFPVGDPVSTEALEQLRRLLGDGATVTVGGAGLRVDGIDVPDFHGRSGRFARDLRTLGVGELRFGAHHDVGTLERFVRMLRDDAVRGESEGLRAHQGSLPGGIVLLFEDHEAPGPPFPPPPGPSVPPAPREGDGEVRPGAALVESIMELFEGDPFDPLPPGGRPAPLQSRPAPTPDASSTATSPSDPSSLDPAAPEAEATSSADLDAGSSADLDAGPGIGNPSPLSPEPEGQSSPSPHRVFGFWPEDPGEGSEPVPDAEPAGLVEADPALVDSIRGLFEGAPSGTWGELPDPEGADAHAARSPRKPPTGSTGRAPLHFGSPEDAGAPPGEGDLGLFNFPVQGELSHPLSFLDEVPDSGLMDQDLALDFEPAGQELPSTEEETEVPPPAGAWDQLLESSPPETSKGAERVSDEELEGEPGPEEGPEGGRGPAAGKVPLWEMEPEIPVWHREEGQGTPPPTATVGPDGVHNLFHRVLTGSGDQRRQAAEALRSYAGPTFNPRLLDELSNGILDLLRGGPGATERTGLSLDLARELATPGVTSRLVARLGQEQSREVRRELVGLFFRLGEPMARALVDALAEEVDRASRRNYLEALAGMGPEGLSAVNRMLNDSHWFVVRNGLTILGEMGDEGAAGRVAPVLVHSDPRVRREAVATLARLGGEQADRLVEQRLSDPAPDVRSAAAAGVGLRRMGRAREALQGMLASETESSVLEAVMGALGALGDATSVPALEKKASGSFLSRPPREIRIAAYRALQAIGTPHARSIVEAARKDRDPEIRAAIEAIGGSPPHS